jgi:hypothetical protein
MAKSATMTFSVGTAVWMGMHPESKIAKNGEYYVKDADRAPVEKKPVREITFLDPACGSGHFHLEAFDLFYSMYQEEGELTAPEDICNAILTKNLFGIDIDPRAVQIAEAALWMKAAERAFDYKGVATNLVAAAASHLKGEAWEEFLASFEREPSVARVLRQFARTMEHIDEIGSLARPDVDLREIIKEEHATWERQVSEKKEANYLFPEMNEAAVSGQLPFHEISDDEFGDRLFYRAKAGIDAFTERARAAGEFEDQMLGSETRAGFRLVDLLSRRYDVVAANPPYMTVYSMGDSLREWLSHFFPDTFYDLFSAFLQRGAELASSKGSIAFVAQSSFLTIRNYTNLRSLLLEKAVPSLVADLGTGAFSEITGAKVNVVLYIGGGSNASRPAYFLDLRVSEDKAKSLHVSSASSKTHCVIPDTFTRIPRSPFIYSLPQSLRHLLSAGDSLRNHGQAYLGLKTANNARYCRMAWEAPNAETSTRRWRKLVSETNSWPYFCESFARVSFRDADVRYFREHVSAQIYNKALWDRPGLTFGAAAGRGFDVKLFDEAEMVLNSSNLILLDDSDSRQVLVGVLNSSLFRVLMNLLNPTINNTPGDVHRLPWPALPSDICQTVERAVAEIRQAIIVQRRAEPDSPLFEVTHGGKASFSQRARNEIKDQFEAQLREVLAKATIERIVANHFLATSTDLDFVLDWYGIAPCHVVRGGVAEGRSMSVDSLHADCTLERIALQLEVPPDQIGFETYAAEVVEEQVPLATAKCVERLGLSLLGHRWPKQIEAGERVPTWADADGIIPLTPLANKSTLVERVRQRLKAEEIDAVDFAELMGAPLDAWLATEFFKHHTKQFKKRPIAWQLQSGTFTARTSPAFACLFYYHKLDADMVPKLRSQYVAPLRQRLETELRGIVGIAADARSDRQEKRRGELDDAIHELQKFDTVLEIVASTGFGSQSLFPTLRQYAFNDAMLALKVRWLRRLTELIAKSPLPDWLAAADRTELHPDFCVWIADAMAHLDYYCGKVGPKAPDQAKLTSDPTAADLAKLITPHAKEILKDTLELACEKWYAQFDEIVLGPDKDKVKKLREEQKSCEEQLEANPAPSAVEVRDLKYRVKEIKEDMKVLTAKIKRRAALANTVRTQIEGWKSKESAGWGDWLAGQPLFDRIAILDGRRAAPTTIAEFITQESLYAPDINDGVRVNIAPLQKAGVLAADVLAGKDLDKAIADRAEWRADERRWVREGKLPQPGWWAENGKK